MILRFSVYHVVYFTMCCLFSILQHYFKIVLKCHLKVQNGKVQNPRGDYQNIYLTTIRPRIPLQEICPSELFTQTTITKASIPVYLLQRLLYQNMGTA